MHTRHTCSAVSCAVARACMPHWLTGQCASATCCAPAGQITIDMRERARHAIVLTTLEMTTDDNGHHHHAIRARGRRTMQGECLRATSFGKQTFTHMCSRYSMYVCSMSECVWHIRCILCIWHAHAQHDTAQKTHTCRCRDADALKHEAQQ